MPPLNSIMTNKIKVKKSKTKKSFIFNVFFKGYVPFMFSGFLVLAIVFCILDFGLGYDEQTLDHYASIVFPSYCAICLLLLATLPLLKVKQAKIDLRNYDFSHHNPEECQLSFKSCIPLEKIYCIAGPFDDDETVDFRGAEVDRYMEQINKENIVSVELLDKDFDFHQFGVIDVTDKNNLFQIKKEKNGNSLEITLNAVNSVEFTNEGITANGVFYPYDKVKAEFNAFCHSYIDVMWHFDNCICADVTFSLGSDELYTNFALSGNILAIADKFNIEIENRNIADYIISNPERAFKQLALKGKITL